MENNLKSGLIIGLALVISAAVLGGFFYQTMKPRHTIDVVGIASRNFEADTVKWRVILNAHAAPDELQQGYQRLDEQRSRLVSFLAGVGVSEDGINMKPVNVMEQYEYNNEKGMNQRIFTGYQLQQFFYIISDKIDEIENLAFNPIELLKNDIAIKNSNLEYYSSRIDQLKKDIIAEATVNARERAAKMLENTSIKPGKLLSIRSGVFQITEPYSTSVSSGGIYDTSTRKKQIRVTVHAKFNIK